MGSDDPSDADDQERLAVRHLVQAVITSQVVTLNRDDRDKILQEAIDKHGGDRVIHCVGGFIFSNAADEVVPEVASDRFFYLLTRIGELSELVASLTDRSAVEVVGQLASEDWTADGDEDELSPEDRKTVEAMRAAQVCVVAHHFVRRGSAPWGIQKSLDLDDMCVVVSMLGLLLVRLVELVENEHAMTVVNVLLDDVELILDRLAHWRGVSVAELVREYFAQLAIADM